MSASTKPTGRHKGIVTGRTPRGTTPRHRLEIIWFTPRPIEDQK